MIIESPLELGAPRRRVWRNKNELVDNGNNTYYFKEEEPKEIGYGSEVIVVDSPGKLLFYDSDTHLLYDWTV